MKVVDKAYGETAIGTGSIVAVMIEVSEDLYRYVHWHCESPLQAEQDYKGLALLTAEEIIEIFGKGTLYHESELLSPYLYRGIPRVKATRKYLRLY